MELDDEELGGALIQQEVVATIDKGGIQGFLSAGMQAVFRGKARFARLLTQDESSVSYFLEQKHEQLVPTVTQIRFPWCSK